MKSERVTRRRWLQFSLRGLLALMVAVALGLGWIANERRKVWLENRAVAEIERLGGGTARKSCDPCDPWRERVYGVHYGEPVEWVFLPSWTPPVGYRSLEFLRALKNSSLIGATHTDDLVSVFLKHRELEELDLSGSDITDAGALRLAELPHLKRLKLDHTVITDRTLDAWADRPFSDVSIRNTNVTRAGAKRFLDRQPDIRCFEYAPVPSPAHQQAVRKLIRLGAAVDMEFPEDGEIVFTKYQRTPNDVDRPVTHVFFFRTGVNLGEWDIEPADLQPLARLESNRTIAIDEPLCGERYLEEFIRLDVVQGIHTNVEHTSVSSSALTPQTLRLLPRMKRLESLWLVLDCLRDDTLECLPRIGKLRTLGLASDGSIEAAVTGLQPLSECRLLQKVRLSGITLPRGGLRPLPECRALQELSLYAMTLPGDSLRALAECPKLERLTLWDVDLSNCNQQAFREMPRLRSLTFDGRGEYDFDLNTIGPLPSLEALSLSDVHLSEDEFDVLTQFANLQSLEIHDIPLGDEHMQRLARLQKLEVLTFEISDPSRFPKCGLTPASLEHLRKLPSLRKVKLPWDYGLDNATVTGFWEEIWNRGVARDEKNTPASDCGP